MKRNLKNDIPVSTEMKIEQDSNLFTNELRSKPSIVIQKDT